MTKLGVDFPFLELLKKHGLNEYMKKFRGQTSTVSINEAYNGLKDHFPCLFSHITQFKHSKNNKNHYQHKLFNTDGIIPILFQFLDLASLTKCSLVHSIWLYHSFNPISIYYFVANGNNLRCMNNIWSHRLSKIQALRINLMTLEPAKCKKLETNNEFDISQKTKWQEKVLTKLTKLISTSKRMLKKVEIVTGKYIILSLITHCLRNNNIDINLEQFSCCLSTDTYSFAAEFQLDSIDSCVTFDSPLPFLQLQLTNCHTVKLENCGISRFGIVLSDKCKYLCISGIVDSQHNFLSDESDCSGIQTLAMNSIEFIRGSYRWCSSDKIDDGIYIIDNIASGEKMNIFNKARFIKMENLVIDYITPDTLSLWQHLSNNLNSLNLSMNTNPIVTLIVRMNDKYQCSIGYRCSHAAACFVALSKMTKLKQIIPAQRLIMNITWMNMRKIKLFKSVLFEKSAMQQYVKTIELKICHQEKKKTAYQNPIGEAFFSDKINCKDATFESTMFIKPDNIMSKINTNKQLEQNGIECGVPNKCLIGWKRLDIDSPNLNEYSNCFDVCVASVSALKFNEKTKKIFIQYGQMQCLFNTKEVGTWHQLPNDNFYLCPQSKNYNMDNKNLIYRMHEILII